MLADLSRITVGETPCLVVLRDALERNLLTMQKRCDAVGVALRAHGKMHKCSTLAKLQIARGAVGVCAQTVGEGEIFLRAGISDVLVTSPPAMSSAERIAGLANLGRLCVVVDDSRLVEALAGAAVRQGVELKILVDVDLGQHRTGVQVGEVVALAHLIAQTQGVVFAGVQAYLGHLQHITDAGVRFAVNEAGLLRLGKALDALKGEGLHPATVTGGGTGTHPSDLKSGLFTEIQAGSYAVMDAEYGACAPPGGDHWPFEPALFLASRVVSERHKTHVIVDAGLKALSTDGPRAKVAFGAAEGSVWSPMGDEHGAIFHPSALAALREAGSDPLAFEATIQASDAELMKASDAPELGDVVWLQPGHCDPTINLHDALFIAEPDGSLSRWPIDARRTTLHPG